VLSEQEIQTQLDDIQALKFKVEDRIRKGSQDVTDLRTQRALTEDVIIARTAELAQEFKSAYPDARPIMIAVMNGSFPFASELNRALTRLGYDFQFDTMRASSYGNGMTSGTLKIESTPKLSVAGRTAVIVEDVFDTGKTCDAIRKYLLDEGAKAVVVITLVNKDQLRKEGILDPEFAGFILDKEAFIVGYGMDYRELLRNEPWIRVVDTALLPTAEEAALLDSEPKLIQRQKDLRAQEARTSVGFSKDSIFHHSPQGPASVIPGSAATPG
jgi:hypoxanthine phosphoribosyltransferase